MTDLNVVPKGLASFLGLQGNAEIPKDLMDELFASLDVNDFYLESHLQSYVNTNLLRDLTTGGGVNTEPFTVPTPQVANEIWYVRDFSCSVSNYTASPVQALVQTAYVGLPIGGGVTTPCAVPTNVSAGEALANQSGFGSNFLHTGAISRPFFVPPGGDLGFFVQQFRVAAASTYTAVLRARIARFRV